MRSPLLAASVFLLSVVTPGVAGEVEDHLVRFPEATRHQRFDASEILVNLYVSDVLLYLSARLDLDVYVDAPAEALQHVVDLEPEGRLRAEVFLEQLDAHGLEARWVGTEGTAVIVAKEDPRSFGLDAPGAPSLGPGRRARTLGGELSINAMPLRKFLELLAKPPFLDLTLEFDESVGPLDHPMEIHVSRGTYAQLFTLLLQMEGLRATRLGEGHFRIERAPARSWLR